MRSQKLLFLTVCVCLAAPACASADFAHVIAPGESLSSVAATDGVSVAQLAAANGISSDTQLVSGATLQIPPQSAGGDTGSVASTDVGSAATSDQSAPAQSSSASESSSGAGGYTVQPGDTLSGLAEHFGTSVDQLAADNGLDPSGILPAGMTLGVGGSSGSSGASESSVSSVSSVSSAGSSAGGSASSGGAQPTAETVTAQEVGQAATDHGVSPSLAEAIGYQESGFNNNLVSSTGATGVMQIEPSTWSYINSDLATPPPLSPASAHDNIRGGVLLLRSLLDQTGGDPSQAAAGYYQGLESVRQHGMYSDTEQYVNNVMALRQRFGGP